MLRWVQDSILATVTGPGSAACANCGAPKSASSPLDITADQSEPSGCAWNSNDLWCGMKAIDTHIAFGSSETDAVGKEWADAACPTIVDKCVITGVPEGAKNTASVAQNSTAWQYA